MHANRLLSAESFGRDVALAFGLTALLFLLGHGYAFFDPWTVNDDTRQQLFWMQQWNDPGLYYGDWLADYARHYVTWGVRGLYHLASFVFSPLLFSKILTGAEFVLLGGMLFALGRLLAGRMAGWGVLSVFWLMPIFMHNISGGLARSFAAPLMVMFWLFWQKGRGGDQPSSVSRWGILCSLVLLGFFIPYIYALCGLSLGLAWFFGIIRLAPMPPVPRKWWEYVVVAASAAPVLLYNKGLAGSGFGPMADMSEMAGNPLFGPLGRFPIVPVPSLPFEIIVRPWERMLPFREWGIVPGIIAAILVLFLFIYGVRRISWRSLLLKGAPFIWICLASLMLWFAARLLLLQLFIPSRYLEYTTALGWCVILGLLLARFMTDKCKPWLAVLLIACCFAMGSARLHGEALYDYGGDAPLYAAVRETPKDALYAGHPYTMDNVLTFGQRSVLASYELAHPWSRGYWNRFSPRFEDMLRAYYAKDVNVVRIFCQRWKIDYIVVDDRQFEKRFLLPDRQLVPVCQAPMPDMLHSICKRAGLRFPVVVYPGKKLKGVPSDHPMFSPYDALIGRLARKPGRFVLLDEKLFPSKSVGQHIRLVDVRRMQVE